jgi:hypothetical protein
MAKEHLQDSNAHDTVVKKYAHVRFKINHHLQSKPARMYELSELCSLAASGKLNSNDKVWDSLSCTQRTAEDLNFLSKYYDPRSDVVGQESERSESSGQLSTIFVTILSYTFLVLFVTPIVVTPILFTLYGAGYFAKTEQNDLTVATKPSPETKPVLGADTVSTTPRSTKPKTEPQDDVAQQLWDNGWYELHGTKEADYWVSEIQNELTKNLGHSVSRQDATREYNERREVVVRMINEESVRLGRKTKYWERSLGVVGFCVAFILFYINLIPGEPYGRIPYYSFWIFLFGIVGLVLYMKLFPN